MLRGRMMPSPKIRWHAGGDRLLRSWAVFVTVLACALSVRVLIDGHLIAAARASCG